MRALSAQSSSLDPAQWLTSLTAALDGTGPALLPLPEEPATRRQQLIAAFQPDTLGEPGQPLEFEDIAVVVPTSGSTGEPKGAQLSAAAMRASAAATHARLSGPGHWVLALPLTHIAGLNVLTRCIDAATDPIAIDLRAGFDPAAFADAVPTAVSGPVYTALVPTQLLRLLDAGVDLRRYSAILLGGAAAPLTLLARAADAGARVVTTYGMSETCGGCVYDGRPLDGVQVSLSVDGRVQIAGPTLFSGYRLRPDLTGEVFDGARLITQDLGVINADGRLEISGRADDVIITGGANVAAGLVTKIISDHPKVRAGLIVGAADPEWGERVVAVVEPVDGRAPTLAELREFAADHLEPAALPSRLVLVAALPMLASGKPDRATIRAIAAEGS